MKLIESLIPEILKSPHLIAPERVEELHAFCESRKIEVHLDAPDNYWDFSADIYRGRIGISLQALEHLWACCRYFQPLYDHHVTHKTPFPIVESAIPGIEAAKRLFLKARNAERGTYPFALSTGGLNPEDQDPATPATNQFFLMAVAFILLHEMAHIHFKHEGWQSIPNEQKRKDELEADRWAMDWILGKWSEHNTDPKFFAKRCMALTLALSYMSCLQIRSGSKPDSTHPSVIERFQQFYLRYAEEITTTPYGASCYTITVVALNVFLVYEDHEPPSADACENLPALMDYVAKAIASREASFADL